MTSDVSLIAIHRPCRLSIPMVRVTSSIWLWHVTGARSRNLFAHWHYWPNQFVGSTFIGPDTHTQSQARKRASDKRASRHVPVDTLVHPSSVPFSPSSLSLLFTTFNLQRPILDLQYFTLIMINSSSQLKIMQFRWMSIIITQSLLISIVINPKGLNMRSFVSREKLVMSICWGVRSTPYSGGSSWI